MRRRFVALLAVLTIAILAPQSSRAAPPPIRGPAPQIWFAPMDPIFRQDFYHQQDSQQFMGLFSPSSDWGPVAQHLQVFKLYSLFVMKASPQQLAGVFADLKQRHIALAVEVPLLHANPHTGCGAAVEGYGGGQAYDLAQKLKAAGAELSYVAADEPLFFGHDFNGTHACHSSYQDIAQDAAGTAMLFRQFFPDVKFIDIEPVDNFKSADWLDQFDPWFAAFAKANGAPFVALHVDLAFWAPNWQQHALQITRLMRERHMPLGVIYDGDSDKNPHSNNQWLAQVREYSRAYEQLVGGPPDQAIFQAWVPYATRLLPDTSRHTFTGVMMDYIHSHPGISAHP
jgi:hypothetical protein